LTTRSLSARGSVPAEACHSGGRRIAANGVTDPTG
jgi:hypothetical protein